MNARYRMLCLFLAVVCFFLLTVPANHSEAEDAYFYARMAEQGQASQMLHAHHLLYLPVMRALVAAAGSLGYTGPALPLLIGFSMLCGALAVCLFTALAGRGRTGLLFALALLFSYGFWRYSTTAEIYIPVTAFSLFALYCARRSAASRLFFCGCILSATAALLLHVISWPLVLAAIPFYFMALRRPQRAVIYLTAVVSLAAVAYVLAVSGPGLSVYSDTQVLRDGWLLPRTWLKGAAAFGQNIASANFLFSIEPVAEKIQAFFPYHMLQEEVFMGKAAPGWVRFASPVSFALAGLAVLCVLVQAVKNIPGRFKTEERAWPLAILIWLGGSAATALVFEPANPEIWISTLAPFWLMICLLWNAKPRARGWMAAATLLLALHNTLGGMSLVKSPAGDYCRQKAAWVIGQAEPHDLILTAESHSFVTFLRYHTPARVVDAKFITPDAWRDLKSRAEGRIFVFGDVLEPLPPVTRRDPESVRQIRQAVELFKQDLKIVHKDGLGAVYQCL